MGDHLSESLHDIFKGCDSSIRSTRGAAMGIVVIDQEAGSLTYAGIGNTEIRIVGGKAGGLASDYSIVGGGYRRLNPRTLPMSKGETVVMFTDGIDPRLDVSEYNGTLNSDPQKLASKIIEDWGRETDDRAVLVFRYES